MSVELLIIIFGIILVVLFVLIFIKVSSHKPTENVSPQLIDLKNQLSEIKTKQLEAQNNSLTAQQNLLLDTQKVLQEQLNYIKQTMDKNLLDSQTSITTQLSNSNKVISDIQTKLGTLETTTKNIQDIGKDISSLQDILKAPKLRGNLGEYLLGELLKQIFPQKNYQLQYSFKDGTHVDAIIRLGEGIVPVDSKFPLESFQRLISTDVEDEKKNYKREFIKSVKDRIDEIASKYIKPAEGTFDFAMMYIPAENVFYETIINDSLTNKEFELLNYAMAKHVIPVSPNSFYAYLMALVYGLKGLQIEQQAKTIIGELSQVQDRFGKFYTDFTLVGKHLGNAIGKYDETVKKADKLNDQVNKITGNKYELTDTNDITDIKTGELT